MFVLDRTTDLYSTSIAVKNRLLRELDKHFDKTYNIKDRIRIIADLEKFRFGEDPYLWSQNKGYTPKEFTLYWDEEFVCRFSTAHHIEFVLHLFWTGLREAYKAKKIGIIEPLPDPEDETKKALERLEKMKLTTPEEKMSKDVVKKLIKRKHGRKPARSSLSLAV